MRQATQPKRPGRFGQYPRRIRLACSVEDEELLARLAERLRTSRAALVRQLLWDKGRAEGLVE